MYGMKYFLEGMALWALCWIVIMGLLIAGSPIWNWLVGNEFRYYW